MKNLIFLLVAGTAGVALWSMAQIPLPQTPSSQAPQTEPAYVNNSQTSQLGVGGLTYSNRVGQIFSADDLASKLHNLRASIDQTLPALAAFNEQFSNSAATGQQSVGSALSGIVSDVLHKDQPAGQSSASGSTTAQNTFSTSNVVSVLRGLLTKNSTGTPASAPNQANAQDLLNLQKDLQPVLADLQRLNVGPSVNPTSTPNPAGNLPEQQYPNGTLTPTGR